MKRAAIYARVSTKNNGQNPETQLHALREYIQGSLVGDRSACRCLLFSFTALAL